MQETKRDKVSSVPKCRILLASLLFRTFFIAYAAIIVGFGTIISYEASRSLEALLNTSPLANQSLKYAYLLSHMCEHQNAPLVIARQVCRWNRSLRSRLFASHASSHIAYSPVTFLLPFQWPFMHCWVGTKGASTAQDDLSRVSFGFCMRVDAHLVVNVVTHPWMHYKSCIFPSSFSAPLFP